MPVSRFSHRMLFGLTVLIPMSALGAPNASPPAKPTVAAVPRTDAATSSQAIALPKWHAPFVARDWKQVNPTWKRAYLLSYRSPDLLSYDPDERWGRNDGRLESGGILTEFPEWLKLHSQAIQDARAEGRPILLSLHFHSGYGVGMVSYSADLTHAEAASYPWLIRQLIAAGLNTPDVTVAVDTCNSQATSAHQLRPDLIPRGVEAYPPFVQWRRGGKERATMSQPVAYQRFMQSRVSEHLEGGAKGRTGNVRALPLTPLTSEERASFKANMYGQRGVILATPTLFNLLRMGPDVRGTGTANLLRGKVDTVWVGGYLKENNVEFRQFKEFAYLANAGPGPIQVIYEPGFGPASVAARHRPRSAEGAETAARPASPASATKNTSIKKPKPAVSP